MHLVCCRYVGTEGVYTHTVAYERDAACLMCSAGVPFSVRSTDTLQQAHAPELLPGVKNASFRGWLISSVSVGGVSARRMHGRACGMTCML